MSALQKLEVNAMVRGRTLVQRLSALLREDSAQGTTEYAILVLSLIHI